MSASDLTRHIKALMLKNKREDLEVLYMHRKKLDESKKHDVHKTAAKKDLHAANIWIERSSLESNVAEGRYQSKYVICCNHQKNHYFFKKISVYHPMALFDLFQLN